MQNLTSSFLFPCLCRPLVSLSLSLFMYAPSMRPAPTTSATDAVYRFLFIFYLKCTSISIVLFPFCILLDDRPHSLHVRPSFFGSLFFLHSGHLSIFIPPVYPHHIQINENEDMEGCRDLSFFLRYSNHVELRMPTDIAPLRLLINKVRSTTLFAFPTDNLFNTLHHFLHCPIYNLVNARYHADVPGTPTHNSSNDTVCNSKVASRQASRYLYPSQIHVSFFTP